MKNFKKLQLLLIPILSFQMVSCGTLIYPERRGSKNGRLDVGIVVLDALGLLFGLIPGIIAFAVDFSTGAIYFPDSKAGRSPDGKYRVVRFNPKEATKESLEALISKESGMDFHFNDQRIKYKKLKDSKELSSHFSEFRDGPDVALHLSESKF